MKKYKKRELIQIIKTLIEANEYIREKKWADRESAINLLTECQETALVIGNDIETYGEMGKNIVKNLEEYCENIYQMSLLLEDENAQIELANIIKRQLASLENSILSEIPEDKKEIIFLPYKSSMWDSLESVWKAACEDVSCEVYVVPIPYFDKNLDGTFGKMHYEGEKYPNNVPITSWEEYNISHRKPNIIYIHNPYDQMNLATSIHPMFYAKELKKHTDMLVYIPYFVSIDNKLEEHFCVLPGTLYANRVIVQSEEVRKVYIEQFQKFENENKCNGLFGEVEKKFIALGSPKYDKVMSIAKEKYEIPVEWEKMIYQGEENGDKQ